MEQFQSERPIRVLSLCDGIATARLALEQLGLDIETYFACETDTDAQYIVQFGQGSKVTNIGDVYSLNQEMVCNFIAQTEIFYVIKSNLKTTSVKKIV